MTQALSLHGLQQHDPRAGGSGVERRFLCPLCGEGKPKDAAHRSLGVNTATGAWVCHRCSAKGKLGEWKSEREAEPVPRKTRARRHLLRAFSLEAPPPLPAAPVVFGPALPLPPAGADAVPAVAAEKRTDGPGGPPPSKNLLRWRQALKNLVPLAGTPGADYLRRRGISEEVAHAAGVRFCPSWFGRAAVVFPIRDAAGTLVAAQGRYLREGSGPKARTAGDKKAGVFYTAGFWDQVKAGAPVAIAEAPIDALSLALCGFPALALCGKDGPAWLPIKCAFKNVALAFDADEAGDAGAEKLRLSLASLGARPFRLRPAGAKDWNQLLLEQGRAALEESIAPTLLMGA